MSLQSAIVLIICFVVGIIAITRPAILAKFATLQFHFRESDQIAADNPMRLVWEDEERWRLLYPQQYQLYQVTGYIALSIGILGLLMALVEWLFS